MIYLCLFQFENNQMIDVINQVNPTLRPELELHPFWSSQKHLSIGSPCFCKMKKIEKRGDGYINVSYIMKLMTTKCKGRQEIGIHAILSGLA